MYHGALCICGEFEWLNPKEKKSGRERGKKFLQTAMYRRPLKEGRHTDVSCSYGLCSEAKRSVGKNVGEKITWQYRAKQSFTNEKSPGACARTHTHTHIDTHTHTQSHKYTKPIWRQPLPLKMCQTRLIHQTTQEGYSSVKQAIK